MPLYEQNPNPALVGKSNNDIAGMLSNIDIKAAVVTAVIVLIVMKVLKLKK